MENRLGELVRRRREELGLTQQELANAAGMDRAYLSQVEAGNRKWPQKYIDGLAKALGLSPGDLAVAAGKISAAPKGRTRDIVALAAATPLAGLELARRFVESVEVEALDDDEFGLSVGADGLTESELSYFMPFILGIIDSRIKENEPRVVFEANLFSLIADYVSILFYSARQPDDPKWAEESASFKTLLLSMIGGLEAIQNLEFAGDPLGSIDSIPLREVWSSSENLLKNQD